MWVEIQAKSHKMRMRSQQRIQAKEIKRMKRNDERRERTSEYLWFEKATKDSVDALCSM